MVAKEMLERIIMFTLYFVLLIGNWLPVLNSIVGIWINTPYRDVVKKFMAGVFKKNSIAPATVVQPLNE
jgi:hypothetical protein